MATWVCFPVAAGHCLVIQYWVVSKPGTVTSNISLDWNIREVIDTHQVVPSLSGRNTFGFQSITFEGMDQFIQSLQKGKASLNTGHVQKGRSSAKF